MALADLKLYRESKSHYSMEIEGQLRGIFETACDKISMTWQVEFYDNLCCSPHLDQKLTEIENELNRVWFACRGGKKSLDDFKSMVNVWLQFHIETLAKLGDPDYVPF